MNIDTMEYISTKSLLEALYNEESTPSLKAKGLIEESDILNLDEYVLRKNAARIVHVYVKNILRIADIEDISKASRLRDLYDCRVCVNHIAQVYLRGIMKGIYLAESKLDSDGLWIFDSNAYLEKHQLQEILVNIRLL